MNRYIEQAFLYRHGVVLGLYSVQEVTQWAERLFDEHEFPDEWMILLVGAQSSSDVIEALSPLFSELTPDLVWRKLKQFMFAAMEDKRLDGLTALCYAQDFATDEDYGDIVPLFYDYEGVRLGYTAYTAQDIDADVLRFLKEETD